MKNENQEIRGYGNMSTYGYIKHSELSHHGILGQKWGVRRYQNEDGSLTEAGKKRYLNSNGTLKPQAYTDSFIRSKNDNWSSYVKGIGPSVNRIDVDKYNKYDSVQKQKKTDLIKSQIKGFDSKLKKTVNDIVKKSKEDAEIYEYEWGGKALTGYNEISDYIWDNFGSINNLSDEQYKTIYDSIGKELKKKGIGFYD